MSDDYAVIKRHIVDQVKGERQDGESAEEAFVRMVDNVLKTTKDTKAAVRRLVDGGFFLISNDEMYRFVQNQLGESPASDYYRDVMAREGAKFYKEAKARIGYTKSDMYSMSDWNRDRSFKAKPGQRVSKQIYDEMLNALPPKAVPKRLLEENGCVEGFLMGEPYGNNQYMAFGKKANGACYYLGISGIARNDNRKPSRNQKPKKRTGGRR